jgi:hypothetical protein
MLLINKVYNKRSTLILLKTCLSSHLIRDMNNSGLTNGEFLLCSFLINGYKHSDVCNVMLCNSDQGHVKMFKRNIDKLITVITLIIRLKGRRGRHRMVVGLRATYAISAYHH